MKLRIKLFATLRQFAPAAAKDGEFELEVPRKSLTVQELLRLCRLPEQAVTVVMVNGMVAAASAVVDEDAEISIFPPLAGG